MLVGVPLTILAIGTGAYLSVLGVSGQFERTTQQQLQLLSRRTADLVDQYMQERRSEVIALTRAPAIQIAARSAGDEVLRLGLDRLTTDSLEQLFIDQRALGGDERVLQLLNATSDASDLGELFFTDRHGLIVLSTNRTSDFVQSDEDWWDHTSETGWYVGPAVYDESAGTIGVELAARISDPVSGLTAGVLKALLDLSQLAQLLAVDEIEAVTVEAIDSTGRIVLSSDPARLYTLAENAQLISRAPDASFLQLAGNRRTLHSCLQSPSATRFTLLLALCVR
jgi:hypothetical protein